MSKMRLAIAAAVCVAVSHPGTAAAAPQVDVFSPQGEAKGVRQIAVRFDK
jgi:hypothetical protein